MKARNRTMMMVLCLQWRLTCFQINALRAEAFSPSLRTHKESLFQSNSQLFRHTSATAVAQIHVRPGGVRLLSSTSSSTDSKRAHSAVNFNSSTPKPLQEPLLIHWKGETNEGYSIQFRHDEFQGALEAVVQQNHNLPPPPPPPPQQQQQQSALSIRFDNALRYSGTPHLDNMPEHKLLRYEEAMQYMYIDSEATDHEDEDPSSSTNTLPPITQQDVIQAAERCSLIHAVYQVVAKSDSYEGLAEMALAHKSLHDLQPGQENADATWCVRVRQYADGTKQHKLKRHGEKSTRSVSAEKVALKALTPLLKTLGGNVQLKDTDVKLYVMEGIIPPRDSIVESQTEDHHNNSDDNDDDSVTMILSRRIARGPKVSTIAPVTRICVTNTPLCPTAAYLMCNLGRLRAGQTVLDPYGGSCAILLAAGMMEPTVRSVAIEIAHNGLVKRDDIRKDFDSRGIPQPLALLQGDCTHADMRAQARDLVVTDNKSGDDDDDDTNKDDGFDLIVTDPPYGIRESKNYNAQTPIQELLTAIAFDRDVAQRRLLKVGGKLVIFLPCNEDESLEDDVLPTKEELERAGLEWRFQKEQPLNDLLSRWLVVFDCVA